MTTFVPEQFFDLSEYAHKALFEKNKDVWFAISQIQNYLAEQTLGAIEVKVPSGAFLINPEQITIGANTVIEPGAYIKGPCIIGNNCTIRHGAYIRGHVITGDHCVLGHDSEFKNSILLDHAHAAHFAYLGDSILGNRVNLGAGTVCANLRLDKKAVSVLHEGKRVDTGLRKLGAILGDDSQTGCNSVLNPGTIFGKDAISYPCTNVGGYVPSRQIISGKLKVVEG